MTPSIAMPVTPAPDEWVLSPYDGAHHRLDLPHRVDPKGTCRGNCGHLMPCEAADSRLSQPPRNASVCGDCRPLLPVPPVPMPPGFPRIRPTCQHYYVTSGR
jgi:hypothetical protein